MHSGQCISAHSWHHSYPIRSNCFNCSCLSVPGCPISHGRGVLSWGRRPFCPFFAWGLVDFSSRMSGFGAAALEQTQRQFRALQDQLSDHFQLFKINFSVHPSENVRQSQARCATKPRCAPISCATNRAWGTLFVRQSQFVPQACATNHGCAPLFCATRLHPLLPGAVGRGRFVRQTEGRG